MKGKKIVFELVHDIPTLIKLQEYSLKSMKNQNIPPQVLAFQEDILRVLKTLNQFDIRSLDGN